MKAINYKFVDGTSCDVEVSEDFFVLYKEFVDEEKRNHWRETWRRVSLDYLMESGEDFADPNSDPFFNFIKQQEAEKLHKVISFLKPQQRKLIDEVFFKGKTITLVAKENNISQQAISQQIATIYKKLKKLL